MSQIEQHLVPEPCVEQVQHGVFDPTDVQVHPADITLTARSHPVAFHFLADEAVVVGGVQVAHLIPTGAGPLRHHVQLATVDLCAVAQVHFDAGPVGGAGQRRYRIGVPVLRVQGLRGIVGDLGQLDGQHLFGQCDGHAGLVIDDREGLAPVTLAAEQPVPQPVVHGGLA